MLRLSGTSLDFEMFCRLTPNADPRFDSSHSNVDEFSDLWFPLRASIRGNDARAATSPINLACLVVSCFQENDSSIDNEQISATRLQILHI